MAERQPGRPLRRLPAGTRVLAWLVLCAVLLAAIPAGTAYADPDLPDVVREQWADGGEYLDTLSSGTAVRKMLNALPEADLFNLEQNPVVIAVIDTGLDFTHPIFSGLLYENAAERDGAPNSDDDNNGFKDDVRGWDFVNGDADPQEDCTKPHSHGTHVAGIVAREIREHNLEKYVRILPIKAGNTRGTFNEKPVVSALDYAVKAGAKVINMSFAVGKTKWKENGKVHKAIQAAAEHAVILAAAGNDGRSSDGENGMPYSPGCFPETIGVTALEGADGGGRRWNGGIKKASNFGSVYDVSAPGRDIWSSVWSKYADNGFTVGKAGEKYAKKSGTSMAAPFVSFMSAVLLIGLDGDVPAAVEVLRKCPLPLSKDGERKASLPRLLEYRPPAELKVSFSGDKDRKITDSTPVRYAAGISYLDGRTAPAEDLVYRDVLWEVERKDGEGIVSKFRCSGNKGRTLEFVPDEGGTYEVKALLPAHGLETEGERLSVSYLSSAEWKESVSGPSRPVREGETVRFSVDNYSLADPSATRITWTVRNRDGSPGPMVLGPVFSFAPTEKGTYTVECRVNGVKKETFTVKVRTGADKAGRAGGAAVAAAVPAAILAYVIWFAVKRLRVR